jgi:hypothetical protein
MPCSFLCGAKNKSYGLQRRCSYAPRHVDSEALEEELECEDAFSSQVDLEHEEQAHEEHASGTENVHHAGKSGHAATASLSSPNAISAGTIENSLYFSAVGQPLSANNRSSSSSSLFAIHQDCWGESSEDGSSSSCRSSAAEEASVAHFADADGSIMHSALDQSLAFFSATSAWTRPSLLVVDGDHENISQITECRAEEEECPPISEGHIASSSAACDVASLTSSAQESVAGDQGTLRPQLTFNLQASCKSGILQGEDNEQMEGGSLQMSAGDCHQGDGMLLLVPCGEGGQKTLSNMQQPTITDGRRPRHDNDDDADAISAYAHGKDVDCLRIERSVQPHLQEPNQETCTPSMGIPALESLNEEERLAAAPEATQIRIPSTNAFQTTDLGASSSSSSHVATEVMMSPLVDGQVHDQSQVHPCTLCRESCMHACIHALFSFIFQFFRSEIFLFTQDVHNITKKNTLFFIFCFCLTGTRQSSGTLGGRAAPRSLFQYCGDKTRKHYRSGLLQKPGKQ